MSDLVENSNIRIDKETLSKINRTALELSDGSGYSGGIGVHHHLHCLVRFHVFLLHLASAQSPVIKIHPPSATF